MKSRSFNPGRLDLVSLRLAVLCAASGSLTAAAGSCHLSVSGASARLRRLEDSLGTQLFHRRRHGMEPTRAGCVLFSGGSEILHAIERLAGDVREAAPAASQ